MNFDSWIIHTSYIYAYITKSSFTLLVPKLNCETPNRWCSMHGGIRMVEIMQNGLITWSHECNSKKLGCGMGIVNLQGAYTPVGENIIVCIYCQHYYNWVYSPIRRRHCVGGCAPVNFGRRRPKNIDDAASVVSSLISHAYFRSFQQRTSAMG